MPKPSRGALSLLRQLDAGLGERREAELIALVLGGGDPTAAIAGHAERLAAVPFWERRLLGAAGLAERHGLPAEHAARLAALWELAERWYPDERPSVSGPRDVLHLLEGIRREAREIVVVVLLDARHRPIGVETVAVGSLNAARLLPRDVLAPAFRRDAFAIILGHNHPSGDVGPSRADRAVTATLREAARLVGIELLDHVIVTAREHHSFRDAEGWGEAARAA
jgi:DNA repair protein RadC